MARLRTINESLKLIKEEDKDTAIRYEFIKQLCENAIIISYRVGPKLLLNYDELIEYLNAYIGK